MLTILRMGDFEGGRVVLSGDFVLLRSIHNQIASSPSLRSGLRLITLLAKTTRCHCEAHPPFVIARHTPLLSLRDTPPFCHCEELCDEAISKKERNYYKRLLRFARNDGGTSPVITGAWGALIVLDIV